MIICKLCKTDHKPLPRSHHGVATSKSVPSLVGSNGDRGPQLTYIPLFVGGFCQTISVTTIYNLNRQGLGTQLLWCTNRLEICVWKFACPASNIPEEAMLWPASPSRQATMFCSWIKYRCGFACNIDVSFPHDNLNGWLSHEAFLPGMTCFYSTEDSSYFASTLCNSRAR